ncbi:hypothetical protein BH11VER1_BH11VER1_40720 [soil metagenome]
MAITALFALPLQSAEETVFQQGMNAAKKGDYVLAVDRFTDAIRVNPQDWAANFYRGLAYDHLGEYNKAILDYGEAILIDPQKAEPFNEIAWLLATCPKAELRDGKKALEYAGKAMEITGGIDPATIDTLAAAFAESGNFEKAIQSQKQYLAMPKLSEKHMTEARERLALYEAHKPYHAPEK